jgi:hypothetical protein
VLVLLVFGFSEEGGEREREREVLQGRKNLLPLPVTRPGENKMHNAVKTTQFCF